MSNRKFGYGGVSSKDQNEARQLKTFKDYGIDDRDIYIYIYIYIDKKSGKDFDREQYKLLKNWDSISFCFSLNEVLFNDVKNEQYSNLIL